MSYYRQPQERAVFASTPWYKLALAAGAAWAFLLVGYALGGIATGGRYELIAAAVLVMGLVFLASGASLALRAQYAIVPEKKYVAGGLLLGVVDFASLAVLLTLFGSHRADIFTVAFYVILGSLLMKILRRRAHTKRVTRGAFAGLAFALAGWILFTGMSMGPVEWLGLLLVALLFSRAIFMFYLNMDVISPWVATFWRGGAFVAVSLCILAFGVVSGSVPFKEIALVPFYQAVLFAVIAGMELVYIFFRQKMLMARDGLIARKEGLALVTMFTVVAVAGLLAGTRYTLTAAVAAVVAVAAHLIVEGRAPWRRKGR